MKHQTHALGAAAALLIALTVSAVAPAVAQDGARYVVTFKSAWTEKTHPFEYPQASLLSGPHFSGLIGATHADNYAIFKGGMKPTPGLERLSEEGKHSPLDDEIKAAIQAGTAGMLFETGPIRDAAKTESVEIMVTDKFPMVSAVAMIAPSPDWFAGIANVNLKESGSWVASKTVELSAWDSGGDDGTTYKADDMDTNPKRPTMLASTPHFVIDGKSKPVATLTFMLKK